MLSHANHSAAPSARKGRLSQWFDEHAGRKFGTDPSRFDPTFVDKVEHEARRVFGPGRYFGLTMRGLEHVPDSQVMLVSNHSGGTTIPDVWGFAVSWYQRFGSSRPLHILAHELLFAIPFFAQLFERIGVMRASQANARTIIGSGRDLLVYPGGDIEVWRPYSKRYELDFAGRTGYARLAIEAQVPIIPVAHAGAHETLRVLTSGRTFARVLGLQRIARAEVWPIHLSIPWGIALGPLPHFPLPAHFRYIVGLPIPPPTEASPAGVEELDSSVRTAVQSQLDTLCDEDFSSKNRRHVPRSQATAPNGTERRRRRVRDPLDGPSLH